MKWKCEGKVLIDMNRRGGWKPGFVEREREREVEKNTERRISRRSAMGSGQRRLERRLLAS